MGWAWGDVAAKGKLQKQSQDPKTVLGMWVPTIILPFFHGEAGALRAATFTRQEELNGAPESGEKVARTGVKSPEGTSSEFRPSHTHAPRAKTFLGRGLLFRRPQGTHRAREEFCAPLLALNFGLLCPGSSASCLHIPIRGS